MASEPGFTHSALVVDSEDTLITHLLPALGECGEQVLLVVAPRTRDLLRAELGSRADAWEWAKPDGFYGGLGAAFETFRRYLAAQHTLGRRVHVVAEPGMRGERANAYLPYEAVCNDAFAAYACSVTCLWDSREQPSSIIDEVRKVHGFELGGAGFQPSPGFVPAGTYLAGLASTPPAPPPPETLMDRLVLDVHDLPQLRERARVLALSLGFPEEDVTLATNEVVTNGLVHGAPPVRVRYWAEPGALVVQVEDAGGTDLPPAAGYLPPDVHQFGGRGMWIARQLADIVTAHSAAGTTAVRMSFPGQLQAS
ncbi:MAG TPA: MEDS domain-containing protein [Amycolatopsis sp.]|nr:MEDS domain-containing protein [Amycolatopsis sp.]